MRKIVKFLTVLQAIDEIVDEIDSTSNKSYLFAVIYPILVGGEAVPGSKKCPPIGVTLPGIWYQSPSLEEVRFYSLHEFDGLLSQAFSSERPNREKVVALYRMVMLVNAHIGAGPDKEPGIWAETEMENFKCKQCGHCCLNLPDAICTTVFEEDLVRWHDEDRWDILEYIDGVDLWISPRTGDDVHRCPWLRKLPNKNKYVCRIHNTKPKHCRDYPKSKKHAFRTGCPGLD